MLLASTFIFQLLYVALHKWLLPNFQPLGLDTPRRQFGPMEMAGVAFLIKMETEDAASLSCGAVLQARKHLLPKEPHRLEA
jgi:hypothetical protein